MTEGHYRRLSEEYARAIEVVHGHVIVVSRRCPSTTGSPAGWRSPRGRAVHGDVHQGGTDVGVVLWRLPKFTFRRPDVVAYQCLPERGRKPDASDALIVVEVSPPSTAHENLLDKKTQYARAGIPLYLVIVMNTKYKVEEIQGFRLDAHAEDYRPHRDGFLRLEHVVLAEVSIEGLTR